MKNVDLWMILRSQNLRFPSILGADWHEKNDQIMEGQNSLLGGELALVRQVPSGPAPPTRVYIITLSRG